MTGSLFGGARSGFIVVGFDLGHGQFMAAATDRLRDWQLDNRCDWISVASMDDPYAKVPGMREITITAHTDQMLMVQGSSFSAALASLTESWAPAVRHYPQLRGQAAIMAVTKDMQQ